MRGKRSKTYRKLMQKYEYSFQFRRPYQVLVDVGMLIDSQRFAMDLPRYLQRTLHGEVKIMISQCSIRHLYSLPATSPSTSDSSSSPTKTPSKTLAADLPFPPPDPPITNAQKTALLNTSRTFELRKCNHHTLDHPLSTLECFSSFIDPNNSGTNKHRYCLAVSDAKVRSWARQLAAVPIVYVKRSVMILEPMGGNSLRAKEGEDRGKLRGGLRFSKKSEVGNKRKRNMEEDDAADMEEEDGGREEASDDGAEAKKKKKKNHGMKGPNPLSVKKKKAAEPAKEYRGAHGSGDAVAASRLTGPVEDGPMDIREGEAERKKKRRRKHKGSTAVNNTYSAERIEEAVGNAESV